MNDPIHENSTVPRLLVSVRDPDEAQLALAGGCEILDLKEPSRGSLGMVDPPRIEEVVSLADREGVGIPLSVALGELSDWRKDSGVPQIPAGIEFCKLGLSGQASSVDWRRRWVELRQRVDDVALRPLRWIAVAYADHEAANSPRPEEILDAAEASACAGVLFDTYSKSSGNLFESLVPEELTRFAVRVRAANMLFALAGSLRPHHLPLLRSIQPDIVAVRGAVCSDEQRTARIESVRVSRFKQALATPCETDAQRI
jgi:(5-formylfuran-3-yl)methyl phosphate synthase